MNILKQLQVKVHAMQSPSTGRPVVNQYCIETPKGLVFQSYNTVIAIKTKDTVLLDGRYWDYSRITSKYRNAFLDCSTAETRARIASGEYKLTNLNG